MLHLLKSIVRGAFPKVYERIRNRYNRDARLLRTIIRRQGLVVAAGPFSGMKYIADSHGSRLTPKLLGSYELELHGIINEVLANPPVSIVDVGCAEGYYAVGFARALPGTTVYAYDIDAEARSLCEKLALLNGVERHLVMRAKCDWQELERLPLGNALILCDCEGYEIELLRIDKVAGLAKARLLVELHDFAIPGIKEELLARFDETHQVTFIDLKGRDPGKYPSLEGLSPMMKTLALYERETDTNPPQQWAYFVPRKA